MLTLTSAAAATLREACQEENMAPSVRVSGSVEEDGTLSLQVMLQEQPEDTDEISDEEGVRLLVAAEVAEPLSDLELDVTEDAEGARLQLQEQGDASDSPS